MTIAAERAQPNSSDGNRAGFPWLSLIYALTILVSAFLLFQVQPVISKFILPWFGGSPAVWTTAMLFFQVLLFGGYAYAHLSQRLLTSRAQGVLHLVLLAAAIALLPITPSASWKWPGDAAPVMRILTLLAACVGAPYFVLSSTGPLVQAWFSQSFPGRSPYRLYALSNGGSLAGLLSYPFLVEPALRLRTQSVSWSWGFGVFAVLCGYCALRLWRQPATCKRAATNDLDDEAPSVPHRCAWVVLPALASLVFLATTNEVCQNVAVIPFLWIVPLSLYLLSLIICFDHERWYSRTAFGIAGVLLVLAVAYDDLDGLLGKLLRSEVRVGFVQELMLYFAEMFVVCMICHGELVRLRPKPRHLTEFYLMVSAGGALGGIFVGLVAPRIFTTYFEWTIGLVASFVLAVMVCCRAAMPWLRHRSARAAVGAFGVAVAATGWYFIADWQRDSIVLERARNFYGVISVRDSLGDDDPTEHWVTFRHGTIVHGRQWADGPKRRLPLTYYYRKSGVGRAIDYFADRDDMRIGVVGLGAGTLATYAVKPSQSVTFYEINPEVERLARKYFGYLPECEGKAEVVLGDARLSMEREKPRGYHVLALDAFSGDAIPTHLLTEEAFQIYLPHMASDGVIAVHITNHSLDLSPVVRALADRFGLKIARVKSLGDREALEYDTDWMLLTKNEDFLRSMADVDCSADDKGAWKLLWTDDYCAPFKILKSPDDSNKPATSRG